MAVCSLAHGINSRLTLKNLTGTKYSMWLDTDKNNFHNLETVMLSWDKSTDFLTTHLNDELFRLLHSA